MKTSWHTPGVYSLEAYRFDGHWYRADNNQPVWGESTIMALDNVLTEDDTVELEIQFWSIGWQRTAERAGAFCDGHPSEGDENRELHCVKLEGQRLPDSWAREIFNEQFDEIEAVQMD